MDKLSNYRGLIQNILTEYVHHDQGNGPVETQLLLDAQNDHYQVMVIGWENKQRVYYPVFHLDIKDNKIWVQQNVSDFDVVTALMDKGVPKTDIVLAFQSPYTRQFSGFAAA